MSSFFSFFKLLVWLDKGTDPKLADCSAYFNRTQKQPMTNVLLLQNAQNAFCLAQSILQASRAAWNFVKETCNACTGALGTTNKKVI